MAATRSRRRSSRLTTWFPPRSPFRPPLPRTVLSATVDLTTILQPQNTSKSPQNTLKSPGNVNSNPDQSHL